MAVSSVSSVRKSNFSLRAPLKLSLPGSDWPDFGHVLSWSVEAVITKRHRLSA